MFILCLARKVRANVLVRKRYRFCFIFPRFYYWTLELFRQCGVFGFHFIEHLCIAIYYKVIKPYTCTNTLAFLVVKQRLVISVKVD